MLLLALIACAAAPDHVPGRNADPAAREPTLASEPRGITLVIGASEAAAGDRVDVMVRDPDWRPLAQDALVVDIDPPRVTLVLADAPAAELAGVVASGWEVHLRVRPR